MMAAMLSACGHRASQGSENSEFTTDSIGLEKEDSMASVKVCVDWPASGNDSLVQAIRQYIFEELASRPMQEGEPEVKLYNDGEEAIKATVNSCYQEMVASWKEIRNNGYPGMQFSYYQRIKLLEDNEHYITYLTNSEGIMGGAHGQDRHSVRAMANASVTKRSITRKRNLSIRKTKHCSKMRNLLNCTLLSSKVCSAISRNSRIV